MNYTLFEYPFAEDLRKFDCISLEVSIPKDTPIELSFTAFPLLVGRPEYIESTCAKIMIAGNGWQKLEIDFKQFDYIKGSAAFWRFIKKIELQITGLSENTASDSLIRNVKLKQKGILSLACDRYSISAETKKTISYEFTIQNQSETVQAISLDVEKIGWEGMTTELIPKSLVLKPQELQKCILKVSLGDNIAPGGYENHKVIITPNGNSNFSKELEFITVRKLPHPYILHDEKGWQEILNKAYNYAWANEALNKYIELAEKWEVPQVNAGSHAFELSQRFNIEATFIAWKLTKKREFGEKLALLLNRLADPISGYPATSSSIFHALPVPKEMNNEKTMLQKICNGGLIHEGEFLMDVAAAYDLIYDEDFLREEEKALIEKSFRIYIEKVDWAITDGDCNNIPTGGMAAAILCSLVIQDMHWVNRFLYGDSGLLNFLGITLLDDGWYFEGASNYVLLGAHIYTRVAQALLPWGINLKDAYIPAKYAKNIMLTPWSFNKEKPFLGMNFEKQGPNTKNYHCIQDFWDGFLPFVDHRGILFAINDSSEKDASPFYELAYHMYRKPEYAAVIKNSGKRELLYGVAELPENTPDLSSISTCADNVGVALLRSQKPGRAQREQLQIALRYGTHGGYHGHFDKTDLVHFMRYGKIPYSTECSWYGYDTYLFKMWIQNSISHNMITVDQRMQEAATSNKLLFFSGKHMQAAVVQTKARWFDPPYGGQTPYPEKFPEEKCWKEGRSITKHDLIRPQGDVGEYSEPILQRRMTVVTDDYIVIADWMKAEETHEFDNWLHLSGYKGITGKSIKHLKHTGKLNEDAYGGGQFITDCNWYNVQVPAEVNFGYEYNNDQDSKKVFTRYNEDGYMNVDVHSLWPLNSNAIIGTHPEPDNINKKLVYEIIGDGKVLASGKFGAWILGNDHINLDIKGIKQLEIKISCKDSSKTKKTLFLGDPFILTADGEKLYLSDLSLEKINISSPIDSATDYYGGEIKLEGVTYKKAVGIEPKAPSAAASIIIDLSKINSAVKFDCAIGGDYPLGNEDKQRKALSFRTYGNEAKYITILELHENNKLLENAEAIDENSIKVTLKDGRTQEIRFNNFYKENHEISVNFSETKDGLTTFEENTL
jgi:hypothetical protein